MKSPQEIIEQYKVISLINDLALTVEQKLDLMWAIPVRQQERWERIKRFHNIESITMSVRHLWMQKQIDLMREQRTRLERLKQFI